MKLIVSSTNETTIYPHAKTKNKTNKKHESRWRPHTQNKLTQNGS